MVSNWPLRLQLFPFRSSSATSIAAIKPPHSLISSTGRSFFVTPFFVREVIGQKEGSAYFSASYLSANLLHATAQTELEPEGTYDF